MAISALVTDTLDDLGADEFFALDDAVGALGCLGRVAQLSDDPRWEPQYIVVRDGSRLCAALPIYLSSALDGPLGIAAAAHAAQVLPRTGPAEGIAQGLATQLLFSSTIARRECALDGPLLSVPVGPGLGVELDEEALAAHRLG